MLLLVHVMEELAWLAARGAHKLDELDETGSEFVVSELKYVN